MNSRLNHGPERIGGLLGRVLEEAGGAVAHAPEALAVVSAWPGIVGPRLGRFSRAVSLTGGKLFVEVTSPSWKQELGLQKRSIVRKINSQMGNKLVADLILNVRDFRNVE